MQTRSIACAGLVALSGCAMTYVGPTHTAQPATARYTLDDHAMLDAAQRQLVAMGFQVTDRNDSAGTLSTAPRDYRLTPDQADCGTTAGIDYLKDNRTATRVAYGVTARNGTLAVNALIQGEYKVGGVTSDIVLTCVSRGILERQTIGAMLPGA